MLNQGIVSLVCVLRGLRFIVSNLVDNSTITDVIRYSWEQSYEESLLYI
jgi:hypothetical protein